MSGDRGGHGIGPSRPIQRFGKVALQLEELQHVLFQQDGAPPHWGVDVRWFLDETFPNRWIGRDGPIP